MTNTEKKLLKIVLRMAYDEFSNHGCNEFDLRKDAGLNNEECKEIVEKMNEFYGLTDDEFPIEPENVGDCCLMEFLASRIDE